MTRRPARAALLLAAAAASLPLALVSPASPAGAGATAAAPLADAAAADPLEVHLTEQVPLEPRPGDTLTITGYVVNTTDVGARDVTVRLRLSPTPVRNRSEIPLILAGDAGREGVAVDSTLTPVSDRIAPGGRAAFTLEVPLDDLSLTRITPEVRVLAVESAADLDDDGRGAVQTGLARTFLPWFPDPAQVQPTRVVLLYPLSAAPARLADGVFLDDRLGEEVSPAGRITRLLDAAQAGSTGVSWVVDPALLESLEDMADGYRVRGEGGESVDGAHAADAATALERLRSLTAAADVVSSAYGFPDVVALHRAGMDLDIALAGSTGGDVVERVLGRPVAAGPAWPVRGLSDDGTLDALRAAGSRSVVLSATSLPPAEELSYTPSGSVDLATGVSPLRAVLADPAVSLLVAAPRRDPAAGLADPVVRRQTVIANVAMTTLELPSTARTLVVGPDTWWAADPAATEGLVATLDSPWSSAERLTALLAGEASEVPRARADYPAAAQEAELSPAYLRAVRAARQQLAELRSVAPGTTPAEGQTRSAGFEAALTRTESGAWRRDRAQGRQLLGITAQQIGAEIEQVRILSRAPVTLPGETGVIPLTVANDLDRPAKVGVRLTGTPSVRFQAEPIEPVTIQPGQKQTFDVSVTVVGAGPVSVQVALLTPEGDVFGRPVTTEVRSAAYARAAQGVVIGLFGILVVLLGINFVRRRRAGRAAPEGSGTDGTDGTGEGGAA
ncbi:MAG: DUF6049 family protein [Candidatus Nanopelagicales bacterium]